MEAQVESAGGKTWTQISLLTTSFNCLDKLARTNFPNKSEMLPHFICASWRDFVCLAKYPSNGKVNRYVPSFPCVYKIWSQTILDFFVLLLTPSHLGQLLKLPGATVCSPVKCSLGCSHNSYSVRSLYKIEVILPLKTLRVPEMPPLTPCTYLQIFILFCCVCVCVVFCFVFFLVFPYGYQNQCCIVWTR